MNKYALGRALAFIGLLCLLPNAVDYLFGNFLGGGVDVPTALAPIGIALIVIGAALMKQNRSSMP